MIDKNRAVDDEGWEFSIEISIGGWSPTEKIFHLCRRRRWIRKRILLHKEKKKSLTSSSSGWEYAPTFTSKFHNTERKLDMVRRRRWHRNIKNTVSDKPCLFVLNSDEVKIFLFQPCTV